MKKCILCPQVKPPRIDEYSLLSTDAQRTLLAIETKYKKLINDLEVRHIQPVVDPARYYKSIYKATFKQELQERDFQPQPTEYVPKDERLSTFCSQYLLPRSSYGTTTLPDNTNNINFSRYNPYAENNSVISYNQSADVFSHPVQTTASTDTLGRHIDYSHFFNQDHSDDLSLDSSLSNNNPMMPSGSYQPQFEANPQYGPREQKTFLSNTCHNIFNKSLMGKKSQKHSKSIFDYNEPSEEEIARDIFSLTQSSYKPASPRIDCDDDMYGSEDPLNAVCQSQGEKLSTSQEILKKDNEHSKKNSEENFVDLSSQTTSSSNKDMVQSEEIIQHDSKNLNKTYCGKEIFSPVLLKSPVSVRTISELCNSKIWVSMDKTCEKPYKVTSSTTISNKNNIALEKTKIGTSITEASPEPEQEDKIDFDLNFFDSEEIFPENTSQNATGSQTVIPSSLVSESIFPEEEKNMVGENECSSEPCVNKKAQESQPIIITESQPCSSRHEAEMDEDPTTPLKEIVSTNSKVYSNNSNKHDEDAESVLKDETPRRKRSQPDALQSDESKKKKTSFKPPAKIDKVRPEKQIVKKNPKKMKQTKITAIVTKDGNESAVNYVSFASLVPEEKKRKLILLETSSLTLSLLFKNDKALVNTFYSPQEKKKQSRTGSDYLDVWGILVIIAASPNEIIFFPVETEDSSKISKSLLLGLSNTTTEKIIPNCKDFLIALSRHLSIDIEKSLDVKNVIDPVIGAWLLDSEESPSSFSHMCKVSHYQCIVHEDDWQTCLVHTNSLMRAMRERLHTEKIWKLFVHIEMRLGPLLACMETRCIKVDTDKFKKFSEILQCKMSRLEENIYKEAGHRFSLNSHSQLRQVLYEELHLDEKLPKSSKIGKTNVTGMKSTCESSLRLMAGLHPLPSLVLEYRQLQKLKSTYVDGMLSCVRQGSLSTHWDQTAAATGRLTSCQPNVQAVPKTVINIMDYKKNCIVGSESTSQFEIYVREPFQSQDNCTFLSADFQQIEFRILAHLSNDSKLLSLFWKPAAVDIFKSLTSQWHGKPVESVTSSDREQTKRVVYSVMYGVGQEKLSEYLKVTPAVTKEIMAGFLRQFPGIESFTKKCLSYAEEYGYTETICGRRRYFANIGHSSAQLKSYAQRQAVNFCVQGSAADICKLAMLAVESRLKENPHLSCRLLLQIHDELVWEIPDDQLTEVTALIKDVIGNTSTLCADFCALQVPLPVVLSSGKSWAHLKPIALDISDGASEP